jgi:hypothetical protein
MNNYKACRDIKYYPVPERSGFIQEQHRQAYYNKRVQPYNIKVPCHLQMISEKVKENHQNRK